jgi:hypothetical protein
LLSRSRFISNRIRKTDDQVFGGIGINPKAFAIGMSRAFFGDERDIRCL